MSKFFDDRRLLPSRPRIRPPPTAFPPQPLPPSPLLLPGRQFAGFSPGIGCRFATTPGRVAFPVGAPGIPPTTTRVAISCRPGPSGGWNGSVSLSRRSPGSPPCPPGAAFGAETPPGTRPKRGSNGSAVFWHHKGSCLLMGPPPPRLPPAR